MTDERNANRNKVKKWFITFPHSGEYTPKNFILSLFTLACIVSCAGCMETHEDGITPHLHVNLHLSYGLTKSQLLGKIRRVFPNDYMRIDVRSTRQSPIKAKEGYLAKEAVDVYFYENNEEKTLAKKKKILLEYNTCAMTFDTDVWGLISIDKTIPVWDTLLRVRENLERGNVIWTIKPNDPWWVVDIVNM